MAVKSKAESWKALVYGAVDPQASLTIDKLAGSFVPQAISVRIFGFQQWTLALPQVLEGIVATLVIHRVVRRWTGSADAGLLAAAVLAFTPVVASTFQHSMEDGALTMCLVLAADRYQYAVMHGKLRSLVFCGVWIGVAFQTKILEAWLVLPAVGLAYLLTVVDAACRAHGSAARRLRVLGPVAAGRHGRLQRHDDPAHRVPRPAGRGFVGSRDRALLAHVATAGGDRGRSCVDRVSGLQLRGLPALARADGDRARLRRHPLDDVPRPGGGCGAEPVQLLSRLIRPAGACPRAPGPAGRRRPGSAGRPSR
jgi:hypothetical protein